ncbi:MAG: AEC family transporter [Pirellulales bacterium]|nr:AEC family transporter [Pirellulales bacterium]
MLQIVSSLLGVFLVMGIGACCRRLGWLSQEADQSMARLCANLLLPAYLFSKIIRGERYDSFAAVWPTPVCGFVATAAGILIGWVFAKSLGASIGLDSAGKRRAFALCVGICNYGYMPLPIAEEFFPDAVVDLILHNVGVELAMWSVGIAIITGSAGGGWKRAILSPPFLAVIVSAVLAYANLDRVIPTPLFAAIGTLGDCAIPIGLLLSGAIIMDFLAEARWTGAWPVIASAIGIRQVLMPVLMLLGTAVLAGWTQRSVALQQVMMLEAAMPAAVFPIVLVRLYNQDTQTALKVVLSTSLAGLVLIPVWIAIGKWWLGI